MLEKLWGIKQLIFKNKSWARHFVAPGFPRRMAPCYNPWRSLMLCKKILNLDKVILKIKKYLLLITVGLILFSCDKDNYICYKVENRTKDSIKLTYSFKNNFFGKNAIDTSIFLPGRKECTIFTFIQISTGVYCPEQEDKMEYVTNIEIMRLKDSVKIKKDLSLRENWLFRKTDSYSAFMRTSISDVSF